MSFSQEQTVFIDEQYFASCLYSSFIYARTVDKLRVKYPNLTMPNNLTIARLTALFSESGSVADR